MKHDPTAAGKHETESRERTAELEEQNRAWAEGVNRWVEEHGLPLERYRLF